MKFHIIYTKKNDSIVAEDHEFEDFNKAEDWLFSIDAKYWEIGIDEAQGIKKKGNE